MNTNQYFENRKDWEKSFDQNCVCAICGFPFVRHPHIYEGHILHLYGDVICCNNCWEGNEDGWGPNREPRILEILKEKGLEPPPRNEMGWLPRN